MQEVSEHSFVQIAADAIAAELHIKTSSLFHTKRSSTCVLGRQMLAYILREEGFSFPEIAEQLQYKDHTSAMHAAQEMRGKLSSEKTRVRLDRVMAVVHNASPSGPFDPSLELKKRLQVLLKSGCYGKDINEVIERVLGAAVYQLVPELKETV